MNLLKRIEMERERGLVMLARRSVAIRTAIAFDDWPATGHGPYCFGPGEPCVCGRAFVVVYSLTNDPAVRVP